MQSLWNVTSVGPRVLALMGLIILAPAARADCRLALVLALDVSSSVSEAEDRMQRGGLASALLAPEVQDAFFSSPETVALSVFEWNGRWNQRLLLDWTTIDTPSDLAIAAETIWRTERGTSEFPTAMGAALGYGAQLLRRGPNCLFETIDVSGDGANNEGYPPRSAYSAFPMGDAVVNGLVILGSDYDEGRDLVDYYRREVLRGPGSFVEVAQGFQDYEDAMRRKLEREIRAPMLSAAKTVARPG